MNKVNILFTTAISLSIGVVVFMVKTSPLYTLEIEMLTTKFPYSVFLCGKEFLIRFCFCEQVYCFLSFSTNYN